VAASEDWNDAGEFAQYAQKYLATGFFTHCYASCGNLLHNTCFFEQSFSPAPERNLFDLASLTKALVTAPLTFQTQKQKNQRSQDHLEKWLGRVDSHGLMEPLLKLTPEQLLSHRSGLPAWFNFWFDYLEREETADQLWQSRHQQIQEILGRIVGFNKMDPLQGERYSDVGFILLGYVLELLSGKDLAAQFEDFKKALDFQANASSWVGFARSFSGNLSEKAISTGFCNIRKRDLYGEVQDENCASLGGVSGHAGLFGTGPGVTQYLLRLFNSKEGHHFLQHNIDLYRAAAPLYGLRKGDDESSVVFADGHGIGHMGFTGTAFWIDTRNYNFAILLTNRVISGRVSKETKKMRREGFERLNKICKCGLDQINGGQNKFQTKL
jgi:CubicO group peptidase (beta-lactamase class C family)